MSIILGESDYQATVAQRVDDINVLLVGLDGFTIEDLAQRYPGLQIGLHVKDGDQWVPVTMDDIKRVE